MTIKKEVNNMVGQKFGRLTVLDETNHRRKDGHKVYKCKCDCGVISYEPSNCRWVDMKHQNNNKRNNVLLTHNGKTKTITQWSDELNISYHILWKRHKRGWSDEECLLGRDV